MRPFFAAVFLLLFSVSLGAEDYLLQEFSTSLEQAFVGVEEVSITREEASKRILTEAVFVFSGMIYGFEFVYTPLDVGRGVEESFELIPVHQIPWGDEALLIVDTRPEKNRWIGRILYNLSPNQQQYLEYWSSSAWPSTEGVGTASYFDGWTMKLESWKDGIRLAVREDMRDELRNKPKTIKGRCVLTERPYTVVTAGVYRSTVRIIYQVTEVVPYTVF